MPFFQSVKNQQYLFTAAQITHTLQVRMPGNRKDSKEKQQSQKRVYLFTSHCFYASVSVEAAIALSVFIFAIVAMMIPFRMMERQRQVQASLESVNEKLCQYAYLEYQLTKGEEIPKEEGEWKEDLLLGLINGAAGEGAKILAKRMFSQEGMERISFSQSTFLKDNETINFHMNYQMRMPFSILGLSSLSFSSGSVRRAWIGRDGLHKEEKTDEKSEQVVYIGKNSTRYHKSRNCHYLSNQLQSVSFDKISDYRNQGGGKYYPCAVCGKRASKGSLVFIMKSGSRYHSDSVCSAITASIQAVKLSEVEDLGACSYCGH